MNAITGVTPPPLDLVFERRGKQTVLAQRHVTYPFFVTAPLRGRGTDAEIILQSVSGGLFGDEQVTQRVCLRENASAIIRMPSATIVHDRRDKAASVFAVSLDVRRGGILQYLPRPVILLPGSALVQSMDLTVARGATALLQDGFLMHDPEGFPPAPRRLASHLSVRDTDGQTIALDRMMMEDADLGGGPHRAFGSLWLLRDLNDDLYQSLKQQITDQAQVCYWGMTRLRKNCGLMIRFAARDGGDLDEGMTAIREAITPALN